MNILIISRCLSIGGAERVATTWANGLSKKGNKLFFLTDTSIPQTYYLDHRVEIISSVDEPYRSKSLWESLKIRFSYTRQIKSIIEEKSIDVIVKVMHVNAIELLIAVHLSKRRPTIIMTDHNAYERPKSAPMSTISKFQKFWLNRLFDKVTVLTNRDKEITNNHNLTNVEVLYNPLSIQPLGDKKIPERKNIILAVGRLDSWHYKGFDNLIKAWNNICKRFPDWKLRIVGTGTESTKKFLKSLSTNMDQLEIVNFNQDITYEYRQASIFVLSSRYEGWGLVLVEAMSQKCACIACDFIGRQKEIIDNYDTGILCKPDDVNSLIRSIDNLISDSELRSKLQNNASKNIKRFSEEIVTENLLNIINKVIK